MRDLLESGEAVITAGVKTVFPVGVLATSSVGVPTFSNVSQLYIYLAPSSYVFQFNPKSAASNPNLCKTTAQQVLDGM